VQPGETVTLEDGPLPGCISVALSSAGTASCTTTFAAAGTYTVNVVASDSGIVATTTVEVGGSTTPAATPTSPTSTAPATAVLSDAAFVTKVYADVFDRSVDPTGLAYWTQQLAIGVSRAQVADDLVTSSEAYTGEVYGWFKLFLGRPGTPPQWASYIGDLQLGTPPEALIASILASPEFIADNGSTAAGYVTAVYHDLLNRALSSADLASWGPLFANNGGPTQIAEGVLGSNEYQTDLVTGWYHTYLDRAPDPAGLAATISAINNGLAETQAIVDILGSPEDSS
jgi:hypothetical protein